LKDEIGMAVPNSTQTRFYLSHQLNIPTVAFLASVDVEEDLLLGTSNSTSVATFIVMTLCMRYQCSDWSVIPAPHIATQKASEKPSIQDMKKGDAKVKVAYLVRLKAHLGMDQMRTLKA
jgi:hypothetical protein